MANAQLNFKFITNKRGGLNLAMDGYIYRVNCRRDNKTYWRCVKASCPAYISTENNMPIGFGRQQHNHPADHAEVVAKQIMDQVKRRCLEEVNPVPAIYTSELLKLRDNDWDDVSKQVVERLPTFNSSKSSLYRARRKAMPVLPKTPDSITLDGMWTETATGDRFLLVDETYQSQRTIVFATDNNIRDLAAADTIYCDGTLYTCPTLFYQIYTIHVLIDSIMTPVVFALLPGKSQAIYSRFFGKLHDKILDRGLTFTPTTAMLDFEIADHNAMKDTFQGLTTKGCFFHYTQCIWRRAQATGIQLSYKDNSAVKALVRRAAILPLVPLGAIEDVWFQALQDRDEADITEFTQLFTDYVTDQWIESDRLLWNHFGTQGPRTTNNLEGWHSKLKKMVQHPHPNIYTTIQMIKDIENANEITRIQRAAGGTTRSKSKKYMDIDRRLMILKDRYQHGSIDLMDYPDSSSELLHLG